MHRTDDLHRPIEAGRGAIAPPRLASLFPDVPAVVDLRGLLLSGRCLAFHGADPAVGGVARSLDHPYAATWGAPDPADLAAALAEVDGAPAAFRLLCPGPLDDPPADRDPMEIRIHRLERPVIPSVPGAVIGVSASGEIPADVDLDLAEEAGLVRRTRRPAAWAEADGRVVALCWAPLETETLWDVAVETTVTWRRRGLAAGCFDRLRRLQERRGKTPVWGAQADNVASLALAARLGFALDARLLAYDRPDLAR